MTFQHKYGASTAKTHADCLSGTLKSAKETKNIYVKIRTTPPYFYYIINTKFLKIFFFFFSLFFRSLLRWKLLIKRMYWLSRNMLQHRPISFRCTKVAVLNIGGTLSYLSLKSTNKKRQFFRLPDFWIFLPTFWSQKFLYFEVIFIRTECPICDYTVNEFFNLCELIAI